MLHAPPTRLPSDPVIGWLLDADPALRCQVMRDLTYTQQSHGGPGFGDSPFFEGEVEPCSNDRVVALGAYFGERNDRLVARLLSEQLEDGGWNSEAERGIAGEVGAPNRWITLRALRVLDWYANALL